LTAITVASVVSPMSTRRLVGSSAFLKVLLESSPCNCAACSVCFLFWYYGFVVIFLTYLVIHSWMEKACYLSFMVCEFLNSWMENVSTFPSQFCEFHLGWGCLRCMLVPTPARNEGMMFF
jgi:hypothetical protein